MNDDAWRGAARAASGRISFRADEDRDVGRDQAHAGDREGQRRTCGCIGAGYRVGDLERAVGRALPGLTFAELS